MRSRAGAIADEALDILGTACTAVFVFIFLFTFVLKNVTVNGESMENTLYDGDRIVALSFLYEPKPGDIVFISSESMKEVIAKRVIAEAGDVLEIDYSANSVYRNGEKLDEPYVRETMTDRPEFAPDFKDGKSGRYVYRVPFGKYFVLGDNRNHSTDSRIFGFVTRDEIICKAYFRYSSDKGGFGTVE